MSDVLSKLRDV